MPTAYTRLATSITALVRATLTISPQAAPASRTPSAPAILSSDSSVGFASPASQGADQHLPCACFVCQVVLRNKRVIKTGPANRPLVVAERLTTTDW
jgi:hypothetical protein